MSLRRQQSPFLWPCCPLGCRPQVPKTCCGEACCSRQNPLPRCLAVAVCLIRPAVLPAGLRASAEQAQGEPHAGAELLPLPAASHPCSRARAEAPPRPPIPGRAKAWEAFLPPR